MGVGAVGPRGVRRRRGLVLPAVIAVAVGAVVLPAVLGRGVPSASATVGLYATEVAADAPIHWWRLGDTSAPAMDSAGSRSCSSSGSPAFGSTGLLINDADGAVSVGGSDHLECGGWMSLIGEPEATLEAWVTVDSLPSSWPYLSAVAGWEGFQLRVDGSGYVEFVLADGCCTRIARSSSPIAVGEPHHLVGVFDHGAVSLFVDGVLSGSASGWSTSGSHGYFWIGDALHSGRSLVGTVDEVAMYDTALAGGRVVTHFEAGRDGFTAPVADTYSSTVLGDSPSRYWRLGDASGSPVVATEGSPCRSVAGPVQDVSGVLDASADTAVSFDGTNHLDCGLAGYGSRSGASIEAWVQLDSLPTTSPYLATIAGWEGFQLRVDGGGYVEFVAGDGCCLRVARSLSPIFPGEPHHLVGVFNSGSEVLYVDGVNAGRTSGWSTLEAWGSFWIGRSSSYAGRDLDGTVDEVATYDSALSIGAVQAHFEAGAGAFRTPTVDGYSAAVAADSPISYWRLGETDKGPVVPSAGGLCRPAGSPEQGSSGVADATSDAAVRFDGSNQIDCGPMGFTGQAEATLEAWVQLDALPTATWPYLATVAGWEGFQIRVDGSGYIEFVAGDGCCLRVARAGSPIGTGSPHHIVGVFDHGNEYLYVDGVFAGSDWGWPTLEAWGQFWIGRSSSYGNRDLAGTVDEVAVYDSALDGSDVADHHSVGASILADGPMTLDESRGGGSCATCARSDQNVDPVSLPSGEYWRTFDDFAFPGRGVPLSVSHSYSSTASSADGPLGFGWSMDFLTVGLDVDPMSGQVTITQENGSKVTFDEDPGSPGGYVPAKARTVAELVLNGGGSWTYTESLTHRVFDFDSGGKLTTVSSEIGNTNAATILGYSSGKLDTITDAAGRELTFAWTGDRVTGITDNMTPSRSVTFSYDGNGDLVEWADVGGASWAFTYDTNHLLLTTRDPNQASALAPAVVTNVYDGSGRVTSQMDRTGAVTTFDYSAVIGAVVVTDGEGHVTLKRFADGLPVEVVSAYGTAQASSTLLRYDRDVALVDAVRDPNGHWSHTTHDSAGNVIGTEDALGRTTSATYNARRQPLTTTDGEGVTTTYSYDGDGNLTSVSTPLVESSPAVSRTVTYIYGDAGHPGDVTAVTDARGKTTAVGYDADGNVDSVTDPLGNETATFHDGRGLVVMVTSPRGTATPLIPLDFTTAYTRDPSGRVLTVTDPTGAVTSNVYDDNGNVHSAENANTNTTTFVYDAEDRLTETHRPDSTVVTTDYNDIGQVETQTDANAQTTTYGYDDLGRLATVTDPLTNVTGYGYDRAGNLTQVTQPGGNCAGSPATGCITRGYDAGNQLRTVTYSDGVTPNVTDVTYDDDGRRIGVGYGTTNSVTWSYDSLGRLTASNDGTAVGYGYDLAGNVTRITYPGANEVTRGYDDAGRMITSTDWIAGATTFDYDEDSNLTSTSYPDADQVDTTTVDDAGRVLSIAMTAGVSTLASLDYSRDDLGQLTGEDQSGLPGSDASWGYNVLEQLSELNSTPTWGYDPGDNLVTTSAGAGQVFNEANQLCSVAPSGAGTCSVPAVGATTFGYDDRGNRITVTPPSPAAVTTYGYDQADRLTAIDTATAVYGYDSDGLRLSKTVGTDTTAFGWDRSGSLPLLLTETTGTDTTAYLYGPGGLAYAQINPDATVTYLHHDQVGSVRLLTDDTGSVTGSVTYDPYGAVSASTGTLSRLGFAGEYTDIETGFVYLRARYYDPATGQFLTRDPLAASTRDAYGYTAGNPLNTTDPSGQAPWDDWCIDNPFDGDDAGCNTIVEQHPEVAQGVADVAGGTLDGLSLGNAHNVGFIRDNVRWGSGNAKAGRWLGWGLTAPVAFGAPEVYGVVDILNAVSHWANNCKETELTVESCGDCVTSSRSQIGGITFGSWASLGGNSVGGGASWLFNNPWVQDRVS